MDLYGKICLYFPSVLVFKIMCFGVVCCVPGFGRSFGSIFLILEM